MKSLYIIFLLLCTIHCSVPHITLEQLDFLNVGKYLRTGRNLLVGDPRYTQQVSMPFNPHQSDRLKKAFQNTYGFRGENLVYSLGAGFSQAELKRFNAVS